MFRALILNILFLAHAALSIQILTSGYHIVHHRPSGRRFPSFNFHKGNAPRYHIPLPEPYQISLVQGNILGNTSPAFSTPFTGFMNLFPKAPAPNTVTCPAPPPKCRYSAYRTLDGSCNHLDNPQLGTANSRYGRLLSPKYADGISKPARSVTGRELPRARQISLTVFGEMDVPDPDFTLMNMQWGQIITHDMSMQAGGTQSKKHPTRCCTDDGRLVASDKAHKTCYAILVARDDPVYAQAGIECLNFVRTLTDRDLNCQYKQGPAEQLSVVTSYLDLSLVYGNSIQQNSEIRAYQGGRMIVEERNGAEWLPSAQNVSADCDPVGPNEICYKAGDVRVNQNPGLAILQTILLREHNRIADELAKLNPYYDDRTLFQEARKINIGQYQHICYYEWLPIFLGVENMLKNRLIYKTPPGSHINDYNPAVDPSVLNSHATAAFRYFHSQIEGRLDLLSEMRSIMGSLRLSDWFNRPGIIEPNFDSLTRGHATQPEELTDINFDTEIKHFLLRRNRPFGSDLRSIDIQRNRDHGLASYNDFREFCSVKRAYTWEDLADLIEPEIIERLRMLYESPEDIDVTVGGSIEAHVVGALAGPTFLCILTEQFYRTRVGDRFFYENEDKLTGFTSEQLAEIRKASMARLLCDNGIEIASMQPKAFLTVSGSNPIVPCSEIPQVDLTKWIDQRPYGATYGK